MASEEIRKGSWDPSRVLYALGRIGYSAAAAVLDIVDNAISNNATHAAVKFELINLSEGKPGRPRAIVNKILIADNGTGMDSEGLDNALTLGSSPDLYSPKSLSKFGMGLKSASASLGQRLTIVSRSQGSALAAVLDHEQVREKGEFIYLVRKASPDELAILDEVAAGGNGTLVIIDKIHKDSSESPAQIKRELSEQAGVVYYYALSGDASQGIQKVGLTLDGEEVQPRDPLYEAEAEKNGNLDDESEWTGLDVRYLQRRQAFQLDDTGSTFAHVTITQLPHPPSVADANVSSQAEARRKYDIGAGNYGFYVYRNGRLIEWASSLGGKIHQDQDLYAFRGRIEISDDADEVLNINVSKNRIILSDIASEQLNPIISEGVKKSRLAWGAAKRRMQQKLGESPHDDINSELNEIEELGSDSDKLDEEAAPAPERDELRERRERTTKENEASDAERERLKKDGQRVQYVSALDNNQLWQRAHDPDLGIIVRVNSLHRFVRDLIESLPENAALAKIIDVFSLASLEENIHWYIRHSLNNSWPRRS
ncbi:hypothetical protein MCOL_V206560 [Mycobacterium colombiense CECT 3035]|uniref:ATP-binding protein n=1 Tax=Mycobacterium colombiense CECT 3035 TaxID=1041522 RepID=J5EKV7_9MYCO|nr:ATP-binding protein [Mycobacterium colombiense]EJO89829.1 hypothetical protein MCOL_V206560 [Mycobacterium colombiense CECT 3035]